MPAALAQAPLYQPAFTTEPSPQSPSSEPSPHVPPGPLTSSKGPSTAPASPAYISRPIPSSSSRVSTAAPPSEPVLAAQDRSALDAWSAHPPTRPVSPGFAAHISRPTASSSSRVSTAAPPSERVLAQQDRDALDAWSGQTPTRPVAPTFAAPLPPLFPAAGPSPERSPKAWTPAPTKPVASRLSASHVRPPEAEATRVAKAWTPAPTKPVAPRMSVSSARPPAMGVARVAQAEWTGKATVPQAPRFGPSRAREAPGISPSYKTAVVTEQEWSGAQTRPVSPNFSQRARAPAVQVEEVFVKKMPLRSAAERRAAFERLTKPVVRFAAVPPPQKRVRARTGRDSEYFERLSKPFPRHSAVGLEPIVFTGQRPSEQYTGRATQQREFKLSSSNARSLRMSAPAAGKHVLQERNSYAEQYDGKPSRTVPAPFRLRSVGLHETAQERSRQEKAREEKAMEEKRNYKAVKVSAKMLHGPTFVPVLKPAEEVCTVPEDSFCRGSDERAKLREIYEAQKAERLAQDAQDAEEAEEENKILAEKMRKAQFKENSFKAQPVPNFADYKEPEKPAVPALPPTSPKTPAFNTRSRAARRSSEENDASEIVGTVEWF